MALWSFALGMRQRTCNGSLRYIYFFDHQYITKYYQVFLNLVTEIKIQ